MATSGTTNVRAESSAQAVAMAKANPMPSETLKRRKVTSPPHLYKCTFFLIASNGKMAYLSEETKSTPDLAQIYWWKQFMLQVHCFQIT
ncbi:MAG: hypothetical protein AMXMBFR84_45880 [Candidatus Hydrogenedentota bacterium]